MDTTAHDSDSMEWQRQVEHLYRTEFDRLSRSARRMLSASAAEDAVQEAFVRFAALAARPAQGCELAYLRSIVLNTARNTLRRRQMHDRHLHRWTPSVDDGPDEECVRRDESRRVRQHVLQLSDRQRQVVQLRYSEQLSEREIAALLRISPGSVKTHSSRALVAMRVSMQGGAA